MRNRLVPANDSFPALLRRVRAGDQAAAAELVRQYEGEIRRAVRLRLDPHLARALDSMDICQSVLGNFFVRAAAGQFELEEPAQLLKLLVKMARNRLLDHARKPANRPVAADSAVLTGAVGREETPSQVASYEELLQKVRETLTAEERDLAEQRALGRPWAEIAAARGDSPERLRKLLERALDRVTREVGLEEVSPK
jgi:RNA polymerase sigma-70 factor (ECF subfamily)